MKFSPCDRNVLSVYKKTDNQEFLQDFVSSGIGFAEVEGFTQKDAYIAANSLRASVERFHMPHVKVFVRRGRVYLLNELIN